MLQLSSACQTLFGHLLCIGVYFCYLFDSSWLDSQLLFFTPIYDTFFFFNVGFLMTRVQIHQLFNTFMKSTTLLLSLHPCRHFKLEVTQSLRTFRWRFLIYDNWIFLSFKSSLLLLVLISLLLISLHSSARLCQDKGTQKS